MKRRSFLRAAAGTGAVIAVGLPASRSVAEQLGAESATSTSEPHQVDAIRVVAWNVACGKWSTPEQIANALVDRFGNKISASGGPDILLLNETPKFNLGDDAPDWSREVARRLGLPYFYVGSVSSANHSAPDWGDGTGHYGGKYKAILSRWPISNTHDFTLPGEGWSPASAIRAEIQIGEKRWAVYSLHLPGHREWEPSKHKALAEQVLAKEPLQNVIVAGDFNVRTDSPVLSALKEATGLDNAITKRAIDHILFKSTDDIAVSAAGIDKGPATPSRTGSLSDHPYAWAVLDLS